MVKKFPPKGYTALDFPLPHDFAYSFSLTGEAAVTKSHTICPIIRCTEDITTPENIEVNPQNPSFAEETGSMIAPNSIVPRIKLSIKASISKAAIATDALRHINFNWFPIYMAFEDMYTAADAFLTTTVKDILELTTGAAKKAGYPTWDGVDLINAGNYPLNTVLFTELYSTTGLTANAAMEGVNFNASTMFDAFSFYSNSGMLNKAKGKTTHVSLDTQKNTTYSYFSNNFTFPSVKRGNPFTFCGILLTVPPYGTRQNFGVASDVTAIAHVDFNISVGYDEWNNQFDQGVL